jgi:acyl carrier protein
VKSRNKSIDQSLDANKSLMEQGLDSLQAVEMRNRLGKGLETTLSVSLLFNYSSINKLVDYQVKGFSKFFGVPVTMFID